MIRKVLSFFGYEPKKPKPRYECVVLTSRDVYHAHEIGSVFEGREVVDGFYNWSFDDYVLVVANPCQE